MDVNPCGPRCAPPDVETAETAMLRRQRFHRENSLAMWYPDEYRAAEGAKADTLLHVIVKLFNTP